MCSLYTLRPSYERLPYAHARNAQEGQESISSVLGPMANSLSSVKRFTKAVIGAKPWRKDPLAVRKEWSEREYALQEHGEGVGLCFALLWDNGVVKPHPPVRRALALVKRALEGRGHKGMSVLEGNILDMVGLKLGWAVIDWEPHKHLEIYKNTVKILKLLYRPCVTELRRKGKHFRSRRRTRLRYGMCQIRRTSHQKHVPGRRGTPVHSLRTLRQDHRRKSRTHQRI